MLGLLLETLAPPCGALGTCAADLRELSSLQFTLSCTRYSPTATVCVCVCVAASSIVYSATAASAVQSTTRTKSSRRHWLYRFRGLEFAAKCGGICPKGNVLNSSPRSTERRTTCGLNGGERAVGGKDALRPGHEVAAARRRVNNKCRRVAGSATNERRTHPAPRDVTSPLP